ncbi:SIMPL domain-containing protein [Thalassoglobus polymorphus]|uniref:Oxidative stress defense protein n=1 Tax=Thalassoglobus polymorphus TaxID=2527994 RepID=A0A517QN92_9PLAN|nr:SIMPL domain-containing protein [Thalassoglobus polymorphus]QDT33099.1 hypothetical protein Mal48_23510 [Thalassoglobus polymorphus]
MKPLSLILCLLGSFAYLTSPCLAQIGEPDSPGTITGTGKATLKVRPERMRLSIDLSSRGSEIDKAVKALQDRIDAARIQIKALGAIEETLQNTPPKIDTQKSLQHEQMRAQLAESLGRAGRSDDETDVDTLIIVSSSMSAEWDLAGLSDQELLVKSFTIQKQVRDAKLAKDDDKSQLSPEEQELLEEAQMFGRYSSGSEDEDGPEFFFYSTVKKEDYESALKSAVSRAKKQASLLATSAGVELGGIQELRLGGEFDLGFEYSGGYGYGARSSLLKLQAFQAEQEVDRETPLAYGIEASELTISIEVTAGYNIKE